MSWTLGSLHPSYYFNQLKYIKGTYIRKDKFKENLKYKVEYINPIREIPLDVVEEWLWWTEYEKLVRSVVGIPQKYGQKN